MRRMIVDFFRYSFHSSQTSNRREQVMQFLFTDYPAYLWEKPSLGRVIIFPLLLIAVLVYGYTTK